MLPSDSFVLRAYMHWKSGFYQKKMDCILQVCFPDHMEATIPFHGQSPEDLLTAISFSVSDIARLANTYQLPEGYLNYLQRLKFDHSINLSTGPFGHFDHLLKLKASSVDFLLFAERLDSWAREYFGIIEGQKPDLRWIFKA